MAGVPRKRGQPLGHAHWSLGTEAALKLYFHSSCLVLAVAMAPLHQPEGKGEHLVQAQLCVRLSQTGSPHAVPLYSQEGMEPSHLGQSMGKGVRAWGD